MWRLGIIRAAWFRASTWWVERADSCVVLASLSRYCLGVSAKKEDLNEPAQILDEEDEATLAAIDRGIQSADQGRVVRWKKSASE
jgi:hypothetical protein